MGGKESGRWYLYFEMKLFVISKLLTVVEEEDVTPLLQLVT